MLRFRLQLDLGRVFDDALHGHLDELVEGVELLTHETFLVEVGGDDDPAGLLPRVLRDHVRILLLVHVLTTTIQLCLLILKTTILTNVTRPSLF